MLFLVCQTSACGGRTIGDEGADGGGPTREDASIALVDAAGIAACVSSEGVRICGGTKGDRRSNESGTTIDVCS
jgi:hypothetical protein